MKKVILSISAMLFVGATAFAQDNTNDVYQKGFFQNASVNQFGYMNDADVDQGTLPSESWLSNNNDAVIVQSGAHNSARTSQNNFFNEAFQSQTGDSNNAIIWQDEEIALGVWGFDNATQIQSGDHNDARIDQGTTGNDLPANPPFSVAQLALVGTVPVPVLPHFNNTANQFQSDDYGIAYASQGGQFNMSNQTQVGSMAYAGNENESYHYQYGVDNEANSTQTGGGLTASTLQIGLSNTANVIQWDQGHSSVVVQAGWNNNVLVLQDN